MSKHLLLGWVSVPGSALNGLPQVKALGKPLTLPGWRVVSVTLGREGISVEMMQL